MADLGYTVHQSDTHNGFRDAPLWQSWSTPRQEQAIVAEVSDRCFSCRYHALRAIVRLKVTYSSG